MGWDWKEHRSNFVFWLLTVIGGSSVMGAIGHAIANDIHGHPTDWVLFGLLVFSGVLLAGVGFLLSRGQALNAVTAVPPDTDTFADANRINGRDARERPRDSYPSEQEQLDAVASQNHLVELGRSVDGPFSPSQIKAFRVSKDLRNFLSSMGSRPDVHRRDNPSSEELVEEMVGRWKLVEPWLTTLKHRYAGEFAPRVKEVMHLLGSEGINVSALEPFITGVNNESDVHSVAQALDSLSITSSYQPFSLSMNSLDTLQKIRLIDGDTYKNALNTPGFADAIDEAAANRRRGQN